MFKLLKFQTGDFNLTVQQLARHLGHSENVHHKHYRLGLNYRRHNNNNLLPITMSSPPPHPTLPPIHLTPPLPPPLFLPPTLIGLSMFVSVRLPAFLPACL
jgi:hypothetical protein